jgi:hypothetical protein
MDATKANKATKPSKGINAVGIFLVFAAVMATVAGISLAWHGTFLDRMWSLNPRAYESLAPHGKLPGVLFLLLGATLWLTSVLWLKRILWGWRLAVAIFATQAVGDLTHAFRGDLVGGLFGFAIASVLLLYLLRPRVKAAFTKPIATMH